MSEPIAVLDRSAAKDTSSALTGHAAALAHRLAQVILANCTPESGALQAAEFLNSWAGVAEAEEPDPALPITLQRLVWRLGLSPLEIELVVLAGVAEEHQGIAATFRSLHPTGEPWPTLGLAALLLGPTGAADQPSNSSEGHQQIREVVAEGQAFRSGLLRTSAAGPFFERSLLLTDGLWQALHGYDAWFESLPQPGPGLLPSGLGGWLQEPQPRRAVVAIRTHEPTLVLVTSDDEAVSLARCAALAYAAGHRLLAVRADPTDPTQLAMLGLHACVRDAVPVAVVSQTADRHPQPISPGSHVGPLLVCGPPSAVRPAADRPVLWLPAGPVSTNDQRAAWHDAIPDLTVEASDALVARHRLDPAITAQLGLDLRSLESPPSRSEISAVIRIRLAATLPAGVDLITPDVPWSDIVLPDEGASQLSDAVARLDHQVRVLDGWDLRRRAHALHGARLLLCGPPGTGKSLAARAVATAAATDLLVVDVSRIVSKWLGETEKNLSAAFDAAERTQAVLMLDEADALFGTRTEISDAHDRYANLETAYLLTRLDRFEGLTILTTNMRANIDPAFLRRIDYVVDFPLPDRTQRLELWRRHLPPEPLADDVDVEALAALYPVPGAWIRNVSVAGAFTAAANGGVITQQHLVNAMRREYAKTSLPFPGVPPRRRP
jgi:ATPase family associated with various cellular activities (AAA)